MNCVITSEWMQLVIETGSIFSQRCHVLAGSPLSLHVLTTSACGKRLVAT